MLKFKEYIWKHVRKVVLFSGFVLCVISVILYAYMILVVKNKQLDSSLNVAAYTIEQSNGAGDWDMTLGHLRTLEKYGPMYNIELVGTANHTMKITGPFGVKPLGIGKLCRKISVGDGEILKGCMVIFGLSDLMTLFLFIIIATGFFLILFRTFSTKTLFLIEGIADDLKKLDQLNDVDSIGRASKHEQIIEIESIRNYILSILKETEEVSKARAIRKISAQVAHDIASPLATLEMLIQSPKLSLPEFEREAVRNIASRIRSISDSLLVQFRNSDRATNNGLLSQQIIYSIINSCIAEKRIQYESLQNIKIKWEYTADSLFVFSMVKANELKRILSNLINNSVESLDDSGTIWVNLTSDTKSLSIWIRDDGRGIPNEILFKLGRKEVSFGKEGGSGLGVYHAITNIEAWGGTFNICSLLDEGTSVKISLPKSLNPSWFPSAIKIATNQIVVIIDDDKGIHEIWDKRFTDFEIETGCKASIKHYFSPESLLIENNTIVNSDVSILYLCDYEFINSKLNGIQLISMLNISDLSILVTGHPELEKIIFECENNSIKLLPKDVVAFISLIHNKLCVI